MFSVGEVILTTDVALFGDDPHYIIIVSIIINPDTSGADYIAVYTSTKTDKVFERCARVERIWNPARDPGTYVELPAGWRSGFVSQRCAIDGNKCARRTEEHLLTKPLCRSMGHIADPRLIDQIKAATSNSPIVEDRIKKLL